MTTFVGIDFEYGNRQLGSICAYGLAFEDGSKEHGFVQLHSDFPVQTETRWHGVTQAQTDSGVHFSELYRRLSQLPADAVLVAHDLKSDRRAWLAAQEQFGLQRLPLRWLDSLKVARRSLGLSRSMGGGGVKMMAEIYEMSIVHHNPADDALVALEVIKRNPEDFQFVKDIP